MFEPRGFEFTGERVIPGLVDENLLNEHMARYRFASRFCAGAHVLDAGCGSGYGAAEMSGAASLTAIDLSREAVLYAREAYARPGLRLLQASCEAVPFADASFDLVTAFEVIEHLERWPLLLEEAKRVLKRTGVLLVSTPNKAYYEESRASAGPNPFHTHEFEYAEFEAALYAVFPHVRMWAQNHSEAIVFAPSNPKEATLDAHGDATPGNAHFFVAACSQSEIAGHELYAWMPSTANLLRERERHIVKLKDELLKKDAWLQKVLDEHASLQRDHEATLAELEQRNAWAGQLNREAAERASAIRRLQMEVADRLEWARRLQTEIDEGNAEIQRLHLLSLELEAEVESRTAWANSVEAQLEIRTRHVQMQTEEIAGHKAHLRQQAEWMEAQTRRSKELEGEIAELVGHIEDLREERRILAASKWIRLGRTLKAGPVILE